MRSEAIVAGATIACGDARVVPLLRVRAHAFTAHAGLGEADLLGLLIVRDGVPPRLVALDPFLPDAAACSAWLDAQPELLAELRVRLATAAASDRRRV